MIGFLLFEIYLNSNKYRLFLLCIIRKINLLFLLGPRVSRRFLVHFFTNPQLMVNLQQCSDKHTRATSTIPMSKLSSRISSHQFLYQTLQSSSIVYYFISRIKYTMFHAFYSMYVQTITSEMITYFLITFKRMI